MNSKLINLPILVLFIAYSCIPEVNGLRCFNCDSRTDKNCLSGNLGSSSQVECPGYITSCVKMHGTFNSEEYVARSCNLLNTCAVAGLGSVTGNYKFQVDCLNCENDLCNSADSVLKSKQIGFLGVIVAFMIKKLLF